MNVGSDYFQLLLQLLLGTHLWSYSRYGRPERHLDVLPAVDVFVAHEACQRLQCGGHQLRLQRTQHAERGAKGTGRGDGRDQTTAETFVMGRKSRLF